MKNEDASSEGGEWKNSEIELILLRQMKFFLVSRFLFIFFSLFNRGPLRFPVYFDEEAFRLHLAFEELKLSNIKQKVIQHPKTTSERENALNS